MPLLSRIAIVILTAEAAAAQAERVLPLFLPIKSAPARSAVSQENALTAAGPENKVPRQVCTVTDVLPAWEAANASAVTEKACIDHYPVSGK